MNRVILIGRLCADPEVREGQKGPVARYRLAVDRRFKKDEADFIPCVAFGKVAEVAEKWLKKGMKIAIAGRIQTGSYENRDGQKVYTTEIIVEDQEFVESKKMTQVESVGEFAEKLSDDFIEVPDDLSQDFLPFN